MKKAEKYGWSRSEALICCSELEQLIGKNEVRIIEIRQEADYEAGHIPGAIRISRQELEDPNAAFEGMMATPEQIGALLNSKGIVNDDALAVSANVKNPQDATRFWWLMSVYGHDNVRVLDGNYENWVAEGYPIETGKPAGPELTQYRMTLPDHARIAEKEHLLQLADDQLLLDVRTRSEFEGEIRKGAGRGGRIPGAVLLPFQEALDVNGHIRPAEELKEMYEKAGVTPDREIILYCMRAYRSTHTLFVLQEILGFERLRNYEGSWIEWSNIQELPVEL